MNPQSLIPVVGAQNTNTGGGADASQFGEYSDWAQQEMAKGFTPEQLHQTLQQNGVTLPQAAPTQTPVQSTAVEGGGKQPSWWEKLLPTAGGIVGGLVGSIGDLAGPLGLATTVGGATLGGSLGQAAENALTGKKVVQGNDVSAGVENGAGELVGAGVSKLFGAGLNAATKTLGNAVEGRAADAAAQTEADAAKQAAADELAGKNNEIQRVADEFKVQSGTGDLASHTQDTVNGLKALGFESPMASHAVQVGNVVTGSNENGPGILNMVKQQVLKDAGGTVNIGQVGDATSPSGKLFNELQDYSTQAQLGDPLGQDGQSAASAILNKYNTLANAAGVSDAGPGQITPGSGFKLLSDVADEARNAQQLADKVNATPADVTKAKVWSNLQNNLKDSLYNRPEVNKGVANFQVTPELESQIDAKIKAEGISDSTVAGNLKQGIINTLNGGQQMSDILNEEREGVLMNKVGNSALKQQGNVSSAPTQRLAKGEAAAESAVNEPDLHPATDSKGSKILDMAAIGAAPLTHGFSLIGLTPHLLSMAKDPGVQEGAYKALSKATSSTVAKKMIPNLIRGGAIVGSNIPNVAAESTGGGSAIPVPQTGESSMEGGATMQPTNPLASSFNTALGSASAPGASLTPGYGADLSTLNSLAPALQKQDLAGTALSGVLPAFGAAGGGQGTMGGIVDQIIARLVPGSAQATYARQQQATAAQLAALLGITPEQALALLPTQTQSPTSAIPSIGNVRTLSGSIGAPTQ